MGKNQNINSKLFLFYLLLGFSFFIILLAYIWNLTVDDAFISFRYSLHLAEGYGLVWNIGETPVEGYSNFLWVLINSLILYLKLDPIIFSKIIGLGSVFGILFIYWKFVEDIFQGNKQYSLLAFSIAAVFFLANPATAMHVVAGLETMLYTFLVLALLFNTYKIIVSPENKYYWLFGLCALTLSLLRFEGILITIAIIILMALLEFKQHRSLKLEKKLVSSLILIYFIPIAFYMIFRFQYFHEIFPMSFYAKEISANFFERVLSNIYSFYVLLMRLLPFLLVNMIVIFSCKIFMKNSEIKKRFYDMSLIFLVLLISGNIIYLFILLAMNYGDRLFYPSYVFIYLITGISLALIFVNQDINGINGINGIKKRDLPKNLLHIAIVLLVLFANTYFISDLVYWHNYEDMETNSQISIGKALELFSVYNYTVATEYAGAIPYYSGWRHIDMLGLNDKVIAKNQIPTIDYLRNVKPDLIILQYTSNGELNNKKFQPFLDYALENNYSIIKLPGDNFTYYLNPNLRNFNEVKQALS